MYPRTVDWRKAKPLLSVAKGSLLTSFWFPFLPPVSLLYADGLISHLSHFSSPLIHDDEQEYMEQCISLHDYPIIILKGFSLEECGAKSTPFSSTNFNLIFHTHHHPPPQNRSIIDSIPITFTFSLPLFYEKTFHFVIKGFERCKS